MGKDKTDDKKPGYGDKKDEHKDDKKDDHKEDDYCMKYDKYADKCNADDKCYFYTAKDGDKDKTDDKKPGYGDKKDEHKDDKKDEHKDDKKDEHKDDKKDEHKDKPGYGEYKRGTGCYSKKMLKKDRRLGGHG